MHTERTDDIGFESESHSFGIVISTLGRVGPLEFLLTSLVCQSHKNFKVALCVQGNYAEVDNLLARRVDFAALDIQVVTSNRGVSLGRNRAAGLLADTDYLVFPNDTTTYGHDLLTLLDRKVAGFQAGTMTVEDSFGPKFALPASGSLDRYNVWKVISPGLVMKSSVFFVLGGFNEQLGTGASSPWQSGEETDLLLRFLDLEGVAFQWMAALKVSGSPDSAGLSTPARRRKLRGYGRGLGRILATHNYSRLRRWKIILAGFAFGLRHPQEFTILDGLWVGLGRLEGTTGHIFDRSAISAVSQ